MDADSERGAFFAHPRQELVQSFAFSANGRSRHVALFLCENVVLVLPGADVPCVLFPSFAWGGNGAGSACCNGRVWNVLLALVCDVSLRGRDVLFCC